MPISKKTAGAGAIAICLTFTPVWEGMDLVAKRDPIGTGHPITYCNGQTDEFGKVKAGTRFTPEQCKDLLAKSLPKYLAQINSCIKVDLPDKAEGSLLDAAYNAGGAAVCKSPMVAKMNAGDIKGGCNSFATWYIRASGKVVKGLINRRAGEQRLCLEGVNEGIAKTPQVKVHLWTKLINQVFKRS